MSKRGRQRPRPLRLSRPSARPFRSPASNAPRPPPPPSSSRPARPLLLLRPRHSVRRGPPRRGHRLPASIWNRPAPKAAPGPGPWSASAAPSETPWCLYAHSQPSAAPALLHRRRRRRVRAGARRHSVTEPGAAGFGPRTAPDSAALRRPVLPPARPPEHPPPAASTVSSLAPARDSVGPARPRRSGPDA